MQGVPIKFRGIEDIKDGKYVYGDYVTRQDGCAIRVKTSANLFNLHEYEVAVKPETVAQLVCYDAEGNEVYEGDTIDALAYDDPSFKYTFKAGLMHNISVPASLVYCVKLVKRGNKNE